MPSIPVDVPRVILEHVDKNDLATLCRVNKICCSCSQDVLYRNIHLGIETSHHRRRVKLYQTLAQSTHLAKRVRSIDIQFLDFSIFEIIANALRNMSSLRSLKFHLGSYSNILDGCTFKLHSFSCIHSACDSESFRNFLRNQTSLTDITIVGYDTSGSIEATSLPNLTRVTSTSLDWVSRVIPGRSVSEVIITGHSFGNSADLSFFTLATAPVQKLTIDSSYLFPKSGELLASFFPSLTNLTMSTSSNIFTSQPVISHFDEWTKNMLAALVTLQVFKINSSEPNHSTSEMHLPYVKKVSERAPHIEYFSICTSLWHYWKRVNGEWVICESF